MQPTLLSIQVVAASILLPMVAATGGDDCCNITLSSPACFTDPAGQLPDGQIRFNGSYPTSTFCLSKDGGLTDQNGFGCIVTGRVTLTQWQEQEQRQRTDKYPQTHPRLRSNVIPAKRPPKASPSAQRATTRSCTTTLLASSPAPPRTPSGTSTCPPTSARPSASPSP